MRSYNAIEFVDSTYAIESTVTRIDANSFKYSLLDKPEVDSYLAPTEAAVEYSTKSSNALGGVAGVRIISSGNNFTSVPEFQTIESEFGNNATLRASADDIGKLSSSRIQNPGWGYSADNTLRPFGKIQPVAQFTNSDFVTGVEIVEAGNGYQNPPNAVLVDAVTRETIDSGSISFEVQSSTISEVIVDVPPSGLAKNSNELYTIDNSNGIPILEIQGYTNSVGVVSFKMQTPIAGYVNAPFEVGDKVFVENVLSGNDDPSKMNSADWGYKFFNVTKVVLNNPIVVTVQYPEEARGNLGIGATFQGAFSSIVNKKIYPVFKVSQRLLFYYLVRDYSSRTNRAT